MDVIDRLAAVLGTAEATMHRLSAGQLEEASACHQWSVRQLLNHMIGTPILLAGAARGKQYEPADFDPDVMADVQRFTDDPCRAYQVAVTETLEALNEPGALDHVCQLARGPVPIRQFVVLVESDTIVHTCDLSRTVGAAPAFPPGSIESADSFFRGFISPKARTGAHPHFAPARALPAGTALDRLLAFTGREPVVAANP